MMFLMMNDMFGISDGTPLVLDSFRVISGHADRIIDFRTFGANGKYGKSSSIMNIMRVEYFHIYVIYIYLLQK